MDEQTLRNHLIGQIKFRLAATGITQRELARRMGVHEALVSRLLRELGYLPTVSTLLAVAEALDCDLEVKLVPRS